MKRIFGYLLRVIAVFFVAIGVLGGLSQIIECDLFGDMAAQNISVICPNWVAASIMGGIPFLLGILLFIVSSRLLSTPILARPGVNNWYSLLKIVAITLLVLFALSVVPLIFIFVSHFK